MPIKIMRANECECRCEWMDMEAIKAFYVEPFLFGFVCAQKWMKDISMIAFHRDVDKNLYEFNWPGRPVIWTIVRSVIRQHV